MRGNQTPLKVLVYTYLMLTQIVANITGTPKPENELTLAEIASAEQNPESEPEAQSEAASASSGEIYMFVALYSICIVFIVLGNATVVAIILKNAEIRRNTTNLQLLSLATARAAIGVFVVPAGIMSMFSEKELGSVFCKFCHYVAMMSSVASILSIIAIAVAKYRVVIKNAQLPSTRQSVAIIVGIWLLGAVYAIRTPIIFDLVFIRTTENDFYSCSVHPDFNQENKVFMMVDFVFLFCFPMMSVTFCYAKVIGKLADEINSASGHDSKRAIQMLVVLVTLFCICTFPPHGLKLYINWIQGPFQRMNTAILSANLMSYSNGWFNIIVFGIFRDDLRKGLLRMCRRHRNRVQQIQINQATTRVFINSVKTSQGSEKNEITKQQSLQRGNAIMMEF